MSSSAITLRFSARCQNLFLTPNRNDPSRWTGRYEIFICGCRRHATALPLDFNAPSVHRSAHPCPSQRPAGASRRSFRHSRLPNRGGRDPAPNPPFGRPRLAEPSNPQTPLWHTSMHVCKRTMALAIFALFCWSSLLMNGATKRALEFSPNPCVAGCRGVAALPHPACLASRWTDGRVPGR